VLTVDGFIPDPGTTQTGKFIYITEVGDSAGRAPLHGSVTIGAGDSTIIYIPDSGYVGLDTFWYVISNGGTPALYDTTYVLMYVCTPPTPIAVNDNNGCMDTTGYVDQSSIVINILANDTLVPGTDTMIVIIDSVQHGHLTINANFTVTYTPDSGFRGNDYFTYVDIETVPGATGTSDTASVCINIVDTVEVCYFPNGISPNGDGVNDVFAFPCNDKYPNATLRVFNRWGDAIWQSKGAYENDWGGTNMEGKPVPDGTYYFVYTYNDGSGRSTARFIVVHR
jgi:gliding motility-associated-like protein